MFKLHQVANPLLQSPQDLVPSAIRCVSEIPEIRLSDLGV